MATRLQTADVPVWKQTHRSSTSRMWNRFKQNRLPVIGLVVVLTVVLVAILAPWISPYSYTQSDFVHTYQGPTLQHWLGTDSNGRDMLTRILWGLRSACTVGFGAEVVELTLGLLLGATAGYLGGGADNVLMRIVDVAYAFPGFLFSIILVVTLGHTILAILVAVAATSWVSMARVVRSQVMKVKQAGYIEAARGMGASTWTIIRSHILPNSMGPVVVAITFGIPANMIIEAGLSVVGLGVQPPTPDLGELIIEGQSAILSYPYLLLGPAILFAITLLGFAVLGDGFRNAFDVKSKR